MSLKEKIDEFVDSIDAVELQDSSDYSQELKTKLRKLFKEAFSAELERIERKADKVAYIDDSKPRNVYGEGKAVSLSVIKQVRKELDND